MDLPHDEQSQKITIIAFRSTTLLLRGNELQILIHIEDQRVN